MRKQRVNLIEVIELGLNIIAQDLIFKGHTERDIQSFINKFFIKRGGGEK